jgi:hypothetical protein
MALRYMLLVRAAFELCDVPTKLTSSCLWLCAAQLLMSLKSVILTEAVAAMVATDM